MTTLITGIFPDHEVGLAASNELKRRGFADDDVRYVTATTNYIAGGSDAKSWEEALTASLLRDGLNAADATSHVVAVAKGSALVTVRAPFGQAKRAIAIVRRFEPAEQRNFVASDLNSGFHDPEPFSWTLGWPTLTKTVSPFSEFFGIPVLVKSAARSKVRLLARAAPLSAALGLPTLAGGAAPLSSLLHIPVLVGARGGR